MGINPRALALWVFASAVGYSIAGATGLSTGLAIGVALSLFAEFYF